MTDFGEIQEKLIGNWAGKNHLHLSWHNPTDYFSDTELTVAGAARKKFLTFADGDEELALQGQYTRSGGSR